MARKPAPRKAPAAKPKARKVAPYIWGAAQERALSELQGLYAYGVAIDTETTGINEQAEIVEIAAVRCCDGAKLYESYVQPVGRMQSEAASIHGIPADAYRNARPWHVVEAELRELLDCYAICAWSGQASNVEQFDRRMINQSRQARGYPPLQQGEWRITNLKPLHYDYRINQYKATAKQDGQGGIARALQIEGLGFSGAEHRAWVDADAEAKIVQAACRPAEAQRVAALERELSLMRRLRMRNPAHRDEFVEYDSREMPRWRADLRAALLAAEVAGREGNVELAKVWASWAEECRSGLYIPTADPLYEIDYSVAAPVAGATPITVGATVLMSQVAHWRFGQQARVVQVLGTAPFETYKLQFPDGDTLTYKPDCIERVVEASDG